MSQGTTIARLMVTRLWQRPRNRRALAASTRPDTVDQVGVDQAGYVTAAGIEHYRTVRGRDRRNPVLVFLHGGPGATQTIFNTATIPWERHVTIVQYDQRGTGRTLDRSGPAPDLSLDRLRADAVAVVEAVRAELGKDQVILAGSSAGSAIALGVAVERPDLVAAYVGVDQLAAPDSRRLSLQLTREALARQGRHRGVAALAGLGEADPSREDYDRAVQWTLGANPDIPHMVDDVIIPALLTSPLHTTRDARLLDRGMTASMRALYDELGAFDAREVAPRLAMPVTLVHGADDIVNPLACVRGWYDALEAPAKQLVLLQRTGHLAAFTRPDQFTGVLTDVCARLQPA